MKLAQIFTTRGAGTDFEWKWRSADGKHESTQSFPYYFECFEDARQQGYTAKFEGSPTINAPDLGAGHRSI